MTQFDNNNSSEFAGEIDHCRELIDEWNLNFDELRSLLSGLRESEYWVVQISYSGESEKAYTVRFVNTTNAVAFLQSISWDIKNVWIAGIANHGLWSPEVDNRVAYVMLDPMSSPMISPSFYLVSQEKPTIKGVISDIKSRSWWVQ